MLAPDHAPLIISMSSAVSALSLSRYHVIMTRHKGNTSPITQISGKRANITGGGARRCMGNGKKKITSNNSSLKIFGNNCGSPHKLFSPMIMTR